MPLVPAGKVYEQGAADGILMIPAAQYTSNTAGSGTGAGKTWDEIDAATYAGIGVVAGELAGSIEPVLMRALPNTDLQITDPAIQLTDSPRLGYRSLIRVGGSFNFAARLYRPGGGDQQLQLGAGSNNPFVITIASPNDRFGWDSAFVAGSVVLPAGIHDIGAWMRFDGAIVDRIVLWPEGTTFDPDTQGDTYPLSALVDEPTIGVPGTYTSIAADGELLQTFDSILSAAAVPGVFPDHQGRIMNNANGAFSWTSDGEIIYNFPGEGIAFYSAFDPTQGIWVTQDPLPLTNAAPLASLTITTEDSQPGDTILAETDYDLTGFNNSDLCLSLAGIEIPLVITQTNPGRVSAVFPETKQGGILLADQIDITLNVCNVGALTVADQANLKPRGALFTPATAANLADYPQAQQLNAEGVPVFAAQLEDHDDGTYSVLVNGAWEFYDVPVYLIPADISYNLNAITGAYVWPAPAQEVSGGPWTGDAACLKAPTGDFSSVSLGGEAISNTAWVAVMHSTPDDNDEYGPGWSTSQTSDENMVYLGLSSNATGAPDRIEIRRRVAGVRGTIDICVLAQPLVSGDVVKLQKTPTLDIFEILVNDVVVKTFEEEILGDKPYPFLVAEPLNTGSGCVQAVGVNGIDNLQIDSINNQAIGLLSGNDTLEFSQDHAITGVTVTDEQGVAIAATVTTLGARQARFEADYSTLWQGIVTVTTDTGLSRQCNWQQPGQKFTNLQNAVGILATASIPSDAQVSIPASTPGNWLPNGHFEASAGTSLPLEVLVQVNDSSGYSAAVSQWFFDKDVIDLVSVPVLSGAALDVDLVDFVPALAIPQSEVGSSGAGWSIDDSALPAGLTVTGSRITGTAPAAGSYATSVTITFPDGAPVTEPFTLEVSNGITATDTQSHTDSATVQAIAAVVSVSPIDAQTHTDAATVIAITTAAPVVNLTDTQTHTDSASAYPLVTATDERQVFNLEAVLK